jgi:TRAP-type C4-dicarboxylate transport system substrate-binding protein
MNKMLTGAVAAAVSLTFVTEAAALEWNVSVWGKRRAFTEHVEKLAELVSAKTNGDFTLNISYGGLSKNKENLDGISIGAFEMAQFCAGYHRDKNPTITVMELPFLGVGSLEQEREIAEAVYQHPAVVADLARWNATLLMPSPMPQYNIMGMGDAPKTLADYEGLAVRATGGIGKAMAGVGAVPTSVTATEVRQGLDSGVIKAVAFPAHAMTAYGVTEVSDWYTINLNPGTVNCPVVVNTDALNDLSDANREALLGSVDESVDFYIANYNSNVMKNLNAAIDEHGIERISYTDDELAAFREKVAAPVAAQWLSDNSAKGLPAQELLDLVTGMIGQ